MKPAAILPLPALLLVLAAGAATPATTPAKPTPPALARDAAAAVSPDRLRADVERLAGFGTRHTLSDTASDTRGIGAARRWLVAELEKTSKANGGRLQATLEEHDVAAGERVPDGAKVVDVVGALPGAMPAAADRRYYVVGHYDSRNADVMDAAGDAPGANDDGSGTALVLEAARVLAGRRLDATVVFLMTAGEEQGLLGAAAHAKAQAAAGAHVLGVLNDDIVGDPAGGDPTTVRVFSEGLPQPALGERDAVARIRALGAESDSPSRELARFVAEVAKSEGLALAPRLVFRPDRFLRGGDHTAFNEVGFPGVRFTTPAEDYSRQHATIAPRDGQPYGDLPRFVDAGYLGDVTRLNVATLVHLAQAPRPPADARIVTAQLETATTLRWTASPEPDVAGYEVVWRETTESAWTHAQDVGKVTEARLPVSKDESLFGVRAYDAEGWRSPVAFALAGRE